MKIRRLLAALISLVIGLAATPRAHAAADAFDGTWTITITDGTFYLSDGSTQPYTGSPGTITIKNGKVGGDTFGGQTSYSGSVSGGGSASFTINVSGLSIQNYTGNFSAKSASGSFNETRPGVGTATGHWTAALTSGGGSGGGGGGSGGGKGGGSGGKKPKKDHRPIKSSWFYFTSTTYNPTVVPGIREHLSNGYAFVEETARGGVIRAVFVPGGGTITSDPVALAVNGGYATYSPGFVPLGDTTPGTQWGTLAPNPGSVFKGLDLGGASYTFSGGLSWIANLNAFDASGIGTPSAAPCPIGTGNGWDGVTAAFLRSGDLIETAVSGASGNIYALAYHATKVGPPAGSLAVTGTNAPSASPRKSAYAIRASSATITGDAPDWPDKLKLHVKFSGGPAHGRTAGRSWKVKLSTSRTGRSVLTTWFTDSAGRSGQKVRTVITKAK